MKIFDIFKQAKLFEAALCSSFNDMAKKCISASLEVEKLVIEIIVLTQKIDGKSKDETEIKKVIIDYIHGEIKTGRDFKQTLASADKIVKDFLLQGYGLERALDMLRLPEIQRTIDQAVGIRRVC